MYLRLPLDSSTAAYNRAASLWVAMFAFTLMPSETACTVWNQERAVVRAHSAALPAASLALCKFAADCGQECMVLGSLPTKLL